MDILSFLGPGPHSPPTDDPLMYLFSSPTTEPDDASPPKPQQPTSPSRNPFAQLDTLLTAPPPALVYDAPTTAALDLLPDLSPTNAPPSPHPHSNKRSLRAMRAMAKNNAPDVSLTEDELLQIGSMHESERHLADSKHLYDALVAFKTSLARHGYRITALHLDPLLSHLPNLHQHPFDFVLNIKPQMHAASYDQPDGHHHSDTPLTVPDPPRKRARTVQPQPQQQQDASHSTRLACTVCSKLMSDHDTLIRHFRHAHQELKPFSCPRCRGLYSSEGTLWHHIRNVHTETPRKYKCNHCDASYDSFGAKTRHEHATHNTATPQFICSYEDCKRAFNFPAHLESHALQSHPGFRPFACEECPKRFPSANGLTRHSREVHRRTQAYSCSCSRSYSKRCHLKRHLLRVHGMSQERVSEEMKKQPHPGLLHISPPPAPASTD